MVHMPDIRLLYVKLFSSHVLPIKIPVPRERQIHNRIREINVPRRKDQAVNATEL